MIQLQDFFPYGELRLNHSNETGYDEQRKYTGHEYDADTGLTYANARYYPAQYGRWLSQDPASQQSPEKFLQDPQQFNSYSYTRNNPLILVDPDGKKLEFFAREIFGGLGVHLFAKITLDFAGSNTINVPGLPDYANSFTLGAYNSKPLNPFTNELVKDLGYAGKYGGKKILGNRDFYAKESHIVNSAEVLFDNDEQQLQFIEGLLNAYEDIEVGQRYFFKGNTFGWNNANSNNFLYTLADRVGLGSLISGFNAPGFFRYSPGSKAPLPGQGYTIYFKSGEDMKEYYQEVEEAKATQKQ